MSPAVLFPLTCLLPLQDEGQPRDDRPAVVSSTRTPVPLGRSPSTVDVIEGPDLVQLGVRFLTDAFRTIPGLEIQRMSAMESTVCARGFNDDSGASQGILGLLDGRQVYNEFLGGVLWDTIPVTLEEIDRIELVRGPGSFLHGPNALHGLVNVITRSPLQYGKGDSLFVHAEGGTYHSNQESLVYVRRDGDSALKAKVVHDDIDEFEPVGDPDAKNKLFFELRFETRLEGGHRIDVAGGLSRQQASLLVPQVGIVATDEFDAGLDEGYVNATYQLGGLTARASWTSWNADVVAELGTYSPFSTSLDSADLDLIYSFPRSSGHAFTVGGGYRYSRFECEPLSVSEGRQLTGLLWAYLQDEFEAASSLWITVGVRWDYHFHAGHRAAPRAAVVWEPARDHFLRLSYGEGFRNPSLRELWFDLPVPPFGATVRGNRGLTPEHLRSFELAYRGVFPFGLEVRANGYYNQIDDLVDFIVDIPTAVRPVNNASDEAWGAELHLDWTVAEEWTFFANYAHAVRRNRASGLSNPSAPPHTASAGIRMTDLAGFFAMLWLGFTDEVEFIDPNGGTSIGRVPPYALLNLRVSHRVTWGNARFNFFLQAFNLLDQVRREHPSGDAYGILFSGGAELTW
jgi:iron complex outermembrane receptor protein